jgi:O-antigen ligase
VLATAFPGALVVYLAFNAGGIFPVTTAFATLLVLALAVLAVTLAPSPLAGLTPRGLAACSLLALFAIWTLASGLWSEAAARAQVSFGRVLLYLSVLALFACLRRTETRLRWLLRALLVATATVALIGLLSRLLPSLWPTAPGLVNDRLAYPITYWNTFGLLVALAVLLAFHHTADEREPAWIRVGAAALVAPLAATLLLTFSRGAVAVGIVGLVLYAVAARPRGLGSALLAALPSTAVALLATHGADLVQDRTPLTPEALAQAHGLAWALAGCAVGAAVLRAVMLPLDTRLASIVVSRRAARRAWLAAASLSVLALVGFLAAGGAATLQSGYEKFVDGAAAEASDGDKSARLLDLGNDGRRPLWEVATDSFSARPLDGTGAGTFQLDWERKNGRPDRFYAYSLPLEVLAELGTVGALLLGAVLAILLVGTATLIRGPGRAAGAAAFALIVAWSLHAGVDIAWQTPAVSVPIFALGGFSLARDAHSPQDQATAEPGGRGWLAAVISRSSGPLRPVLALACLALALPVGLAAVGQARATDAIAALGSRECASARNDAEAAIGVEDTGPRPYEVLAMCAAREGEPARAVHRAEVALAHDPHSWEPRYVLALARASAGLDPRPQAAAALALDPGRDLLRIARRAFSGSSPRHWRRSARRLPLALE